MSLAKTSRAIARLKKRCPEVRILNEKTLLEMDIPGLAYSEFDRAGYPALYNIGKHMEVFRPLIDQHHDIFESAQMTKNSIGVVRSQIFHISKSFYEKVGLCYPMICRMEPGRVGKTSRTFVFKLIDKSDNGTLISNERQVVSIDPNSRKTLPFNPEGIAFFKYKVDRRTPLFVIATENAPEDCITSERTVHYSDYDHLHHVNTLGYFRWAIDAATDASLSEKLDQFTGDLAEYRVQQADIVHYSESFAKNTVTIKVWECRKLSNTLLAQIDKTVNGEETKVAFVRLQFYKLDEVVKSKL